MRRQGGGFGVVMLLVVAAIVLFLAVRAWKDAMPTAAQAVKPGGAPLVDDHGETGAGAEVRSGNLPDLNEMRRNTGAHADRVKETLEQVE